MATTVYESCVIDAPLSDLWERIRELDLKQIQPSAVRSCEVLDEKKSDEVGAVRKVTYSDGAVWNIKMVELSDKRHSVSFEVIDCEPPISVLSHENTIRLKPVSETNQTFLEWWTDFSADVSAEVIEDSRYKKRDAFKDIRATFSK